MRFPRLAALFFAGLAAASLGCGDPSASDPTDPQKEQQKKDLDACGLPSPCEEARLTYMLEPVSARACMLNTLASGEPAHLTIVTVPDGGGICSGNREIYAMGDGTAFRWSRFDEDCSMDPEAVDYSYSVDRCGLKDMSFFNECLAKTTYEPGGDPCYSDWFMDCAPAEPACP